MVATEAMLWLVSQGTVTHVAGVTGESGLLPMWLVSLGTVTHQAALWLVSLGSGDCDPSGRSVAGVTGDCDPHLSQSTHQASVATFPMNTAHGASPITAIPHHCRLPA